MGDEVDHKVQDQSRKVERIKEQHITKKVYYTNVESRRVEARPASDLCVESKGREMRCPVAKRCKGEIC